MTQSSISDLPVWGELQVDTPMWIRIRPGECFGRKPRDSRVLNIRFRLDMFIIFIIETCILRRYIIYRYAFDDFWGITSFSDGLLIPWNFQHKGNSCDAYDAYAMIPCCETYQLQVWYLLWVMSHVDTQTTPVDPMFQINDSAYNHSCFWGMYPSFHLQS